nr:immunoglobulin light chain junction region [Macaca mulatta]MOW16588.1 immunoglobulin light chain junction region [Macaca mulatta]MOW17901.1 immunoglobulin light chain junction region [Macaca mulatta]MOW17989.1 immunoglobulin light chain junction region [Macaca mulatta]MOW18389.1 immunoglobulin light chain junction region [Macaca mulatta]
DYHCYSTESSGNHYIF